MAVTMPASLCTCGCATSHETRARRRRRDSTHDSCGQVIDADDLNAGIRMNDPEQQMETRQCRAASRCRRKLRAKNQRRPQDHPIERQRLQMRFRRGFGA